MTTSDPTEGLFVDCSALWNPPYLGCAVPPTGWWCSREPGHEGPCAARPGIHPAPTPSDRIIPNTEPHPREASRRNRAALRYLHQCGFLRMEPNKHKIEAILLGRDPEEPDHE